MPAPALACALFALVAHAYLISVTHFHRLETAASAATAAWQGAGDAAPPISTNSHAQCLSCRLQRNFTFDLHHSAPLIAPPQPIAADHRARQPEAHASRVLLKSAGRAPPPLT